ncbi:hypothetical protein TrLO_g11104 [Triparma laevis f. longispina]|uniref:Uncharacterized protein n=1 Tax=Triparma laevis f. longispina TaxID=1714387 RepID=A0A9W7C9G4_9STRA|nr:hypothetical protein TrLO_g11104 [Triparma laevis f. longispina]
MPRGHLGSTLELRGCRSPMGSPAFEPPNASIIQPEDEVSVASSEAILSPINAERKQQVRKDAKKKVKAGVAALSFAKIGGIFKKPICGDLFGANQNDEGMLYASRNQKVGGAIGETVGKMTEVHQTPVIAEAPAGSMYDLDGGYWTDTSGSDVSDDETESKRELTAKQRLARTLNNWCLSEENTKYMMEEGGLESLVDLSNVDDRMVKRQCAQAFNRLSSRQPVRKRLLHSDMSTALISLSYVLRSPARGLDCAEALVNLTLVENSAEFLVEKNVVSAFMALMSLGAKTVAPVCVQGLFNLTCSGYFANIEKVIKSVLNLSFTDDIDPRPIIVNAMCNTSNSFRLCPRLIEEGSIQILEGYVPRILDPAIITTCAHVLYNLSTNRAVRSDMIVKGAVRVCLKIVNMPGVSDDCLFLAAKALGNMSLDRSSRKKTVGDGFVKILTSLVNRNGVEKRVHAACAEAMAHLSVFQDLISRLVDEGCIGLLTKLAGMDNNLAKHHCGTAFCNFLGDSSIHKTIIDLGALPPLVALSQDPAMSQDLGLTKALAFAIYNISCGDSAKQVMEAGVLKCLISFSEQESLAVRERVAAAICNLALSGYSANGKTIAEIMIEQNILKCITGMMDSKEEAEKMPEVTQQCVTAMAIFAHDRASHEHMTEHGCVDVLVDLGMYSNDCETKSLCASVLSSLTFGEVPRKRLIGCNGLKTVIRLSDSSEEKDTISRQHCAVALCNISADTDGLVKMMAEEVDIVEVLARLSNTYSEEAQQDCAKCFCNLSMKKKHSARLVALNAIHAIMMIAMVRAVDATTKEYCSKAILNLMGETLSNESILEQGALQMFGTFCITDNETMMSICAKVFCLTSGTKVGRAYILKRKSSLKGLFSLIRSKVRETQLNCTKAVLNLLSCEDSMRVAVNYGALVVVRVLTTLEDFSSDVETLSAAGGSTAEVEKLHLSLRETRQNCETSVAKILTQMVKDRVCMDTMIKENLPSVLVLLCQSTNTETVLHSVRAICSCSFYKRMRQPLIKAGCVSCLVWLILSGQGLADISEDAARALCYLSVSPEGRATMVEQSVITALIVLVKRVPDDSPVKALCALALQYFSWSKASQKRVVDDAGAKLLVEMSMLGGSAQTVRDREIARDASVAFANLSHRQELRKDLLENGVIEAAVKIVDNDRVQHDTEYTWRICATIHHLSLEPKIRSEMSKKGAVHVIVSLSNHANDASKQMIAASICNLSKSKSSRKKAVEDGAVECLIKLARCDNRLTKKYCAIALSNLSAFATVEDGTVRALLGMNDVATPPKKKNKMVALLTKKRVVEEDTISVEGGEGEDMDKSGKALKLKQMITGGLFKGGGDKYGAAVLDHTKEEELLGLPPPTVSALGSPEDHEQYFEMLMKVEGYFVEQNCEYDQYNAGYADWRLPPPKPNSVDSVLEAEEGGGGGDDLGFEVEVESKEPLSAIERLEKNLGGVRLGEGASSMMNLMAVKDEAGGVAVEKGGKMDFKRAESLPNPGKKETTPVKPIFTRDFNEESTQQLLGQAMQAAKVARAAEQRQAKKGSNPRGRL